MEMVDLNYSYFSDFGNNRDISSCRCFGEEEGYAALVRQRHESSQLVASSYDWVA